MNNNTHQPIRLRVRHGLAVLTGAAVATIWGQELKIEDSTMDSGGGRSEGGHFLLEGTIAQPETGAASGGGYTFRGGFWGGGAQVVQVAGMPQLRIVKQGENTAVLDWEDGEDRFTLQESETLRPDAWIPSERAIGTEGPVRRVTLTGLSGRRFFRLARK